MLLHGKLLSLAYSLTHVKLAAICLPAAHHGLFQAGAKHLASLGTELCPLNKACPAAATVCSVVALVMHLLPQKVVCLELLCADD